MMASPDSSACREISKLDIKVKAKSQTIIQAEAKDFRPDHNKTSAIISFKTVDTLRGEKRPEWELILTHNFKKIENLFSFRKNYGNFTEIGFSRTSSGALEISGHPCSEPYLIKIK